MTTSTTEAAAIILLSMGIVSLALSYAVGRHSVRGAGRRAVAMAVLGVASLAGSALALQGEGWSSVVDATLWPLLVHTSAALAGVAVGAGLVYGMVAAR